MDTATKTRPFVRLATSEEPDLEFTTAAIAELTALQIQRMTKEELIRIIRTVRMSFLQDKVIDQLAFRERSTLECLVYLSRRTCRNQLSMSFINSQSPFL